MLCENEIVALTIQWSCLDIQKQVGPNFWCQLPTKHCNDLDVLVVLNLIVLA